MTELLIGGVAVLVMIAMVCGFFPVVAAKLVLCLYPRDDPRRRELWAELFTVAFRDRLTWVAMCLGLGITEGVPLRWRAVRSRRGMGESTNRIVGTASAKFDIKAHVTVKADTAIVKAKPGEVEVEAETATAAAMAHDATVSTNEVPLQRVDAVATPAAIRPTVEISADAVGSGETDEQPRFIIMFLRRWGKFFGGVVHVARVLYRRWKIGGDE